jgi:NAD(P)-dependent dehydrogenase (short-subunit alcohol dehydrogenase family)
MRLNGTTIVVTGGASGLGKATASLMLSLGARVLLVDLPRSDGKMAAVDLGKDARFAPADVTSEDDFSAALSAARQMGNVRGLVHCAGRGGDRVRILDRTGTPGSLDSFADVVRVNLVGTYNVLRLGAGLLAENEPADGDRAPLS